MKSQGRKLSGITTVTLEYQGRKVTLTGPQFDDACRGIIRKSKEKRRKKSEEKGDLL